MIFRSAVTVLSTFAIAFFASLIAPSEAHAQNLTDPIDPAVISITKTCSPAISTEHNGQVGQLWNCSVNVTVPTAPFTGTLYVTDGYTNITTTVGNVISSSSGSGNFDCSAGAVCTINGANFDASGTETLGYQVFVTSTELQDTYPMKNCAQGSYDDGAGTVTPTGGNCVQAQWIPRTSITKTCDPITPVPSGPMTLNCQINVTGTDLATDSYVFAGDVFTALLPMTATISGTMMNVTSTEPWTCVDANLNAPSSTGYCELSAADMLAAGGSSTMNMSFEFTADQTSGQVVNCPMTDIFPASVIAPSGLRRSQPSIRSPRSNSVAGLPDNCAIVNIPQAPLTPKIEDVRIKKTCDQPQQATVQGVLGYTWNCQSEIRVTPTPFAGTFTLEDDASNISIGAAQFLSTSHPANCSGLQTDHLTCVFDGTTMTAPQTITYQLFTALTDPNQPIEWQNCIKGHAETAAGVFPAVPMCVGRVIKPRVKLDDPKKITLKKECGRPVDSVQNGVAGKLWSCDVNVTATPAPFAGDFSFFEDASTVSGTSSANIIGYTAGNPNWACLGSFPQQQTLCSLSGFSFSPSGTETISFDLFAADEGNAVKWQNCVNGLYRTDAGKERAVKGNCVDTGWDSEQKPPKFAVKKSCRAAGVQNGNAFYACSIDVLQTGGAPITAPLIFDEMFSTTSGASAAQYIMNLQGTPSMPNGWNCQLPPFTNSASCTISAADFNGNTGHRIDALISIPTGVLAKEGFKNCAQVRIGDQVVGSDCVDIVLTQETTFNVEKSCKPSGDRITLSATIWFQPYQCSLIVTTNGMPFTGPLWVTEDLHFGPSSGVGSIQNITSTDPWSCSSPPYTASGQGNDPACSIQGAQFPASGTSTLTVDLTMNSAMDYFGAENCVSLSVGEPTAAGLSASVASDCFEIAPPPTPTPTLDLTKTCSPAVRGANNLWTAQCEVTISGTNLPAGQSIQINDELIGSGQTTVNSGSFDPNPFTGPNCTSSANAGWVGSTCNVTTNQIMGNGGSVTLPYTAILVGSGRLTNAPGQNCASADSAGLGLHAPAAGGMACVAIPLVLTATTGTGVIIDNPGFPTGPVIGGGGAFPVPDIATPSASITKTCEPLDFRGGAPVATAVCTIVINTQSLQPGQTVSILDILSTNASGFGSINVPHILPFMNVTNAQIWTCADNVNPTITVGRCTTTTDQLIAQGGSTFLTWSTRLRRNYAIEQLGLKNCVTLRIPGTATAHVCTPFEVLYGQAVRGPKNDRSGMVMDVENQDAGIKNQSAGGATPNLSFIKEQTSPCKANRNSQIYSCGFRLSVTNTGTAPYLGPLVMTDMGGAPGMTSARAVSGNGWSCGRAVANSVSCTNRAVNLMPGASTSVDLRMKVKGLRRGGAFPNCGIVGVTENRTQRVALIQKIMNDRGLNAGKVDGAPGRKTFAALAKLRKNLGLPINRKFDDALFKALGLPLQKPGTAACVSAELPAMPARVITPGPTPTPNQPALKCDLRSTYQRGDICACIDRKHAKNISKTQCGCRNGLPMINGKCIAIGIRLKPTSDGPAGAKACRIKIGGLCVK